jgi:hypothetical protein
MIKVNANHGPSHWQPFIPQLIDKMQGITQQMGSSLAPIILLRHRDRHTDLELGNVWRLRTLFSFWFGGFHIAFKLGNKS